MKPMSDKELDKLFQQSFEGYEVQPSAASWEKIAGNLGRVKEVKKQRKLPFFWLAAASIILISVFAVFVKTDPEKIKLKAKIQQPEKSILNNNTKQNNLAKNDFEENQPQVKKNLFHKKQTINNQQKASEQPKVIEKELLAITYTADIKEDKLPDEQIVVKKPKNNILANYHVPVKEEAIACATVKELPEIKMQKAAKKEGLLHRVRNVGDLVNLVVAKVDNREDKIIEFENNEDEGSSVSGLNLGIVKYKNAKK